MDQNLDKHSLPMIYFIYYFDLPNFHIWHQCGTMGNSPQFTIGWIIQKLIKTWMIIHSLSCTLYTTLIFQIFTYDTNVGQWGIHHNSLLGEYLLLIMPCHFLWFFPFSIYIDILILIDWWLMIIMNNWMVLSLFIMNGVKTHSLFIINGISISIL